MSVNNPYFYGPMVTDPAMFFGRKDELARIRDRLRKGGSTSVIGSRRIARSGMCRWKALLFHSRATSNKQAVLSGDCCLQVVTIELCYNQVSFLAISQEA